MLSIDVIIPTYGQDGINRVQNVPLDPKEGVKYIVSWQNHNKCDIPSSLLREDIIILKTDTVGLSANRNNALSKATGDIVYFADDDVILQHDIFEKITSAFSQYPDTQVATFMMKEDKGKCYPNEITELSLRLPKNYSVGSPELAFRRQLYPSLKFNEKVGINSGLFESGEDELIHLGARKRRLKCRFFPYVVASHPHESTGMGKISKNGIMTGMGLVIAKSYPKSFFLRIPLKAYRLCKNGQAPFFKSLYYLTTGVLKSRKIEI